jgi:hypothetical protein
MVANSEVAGDVSRKSLRKRDCPEFLRISRLGVPLSSLQERKVICLRELLWLLRMAGTSTLAGHQPAGFSNR